MFNKDIKKVPEEDLRKIVGGSTTLGAGGGVGTKSNVVLPAKALDNMPQQAYQALSSSGAPIAI